MTARERGAVSAAASSAASSDSMDGPSARPTGFATSQLAWGGIATLICSAMALLEPNLLEEGILLHLAQRIVGGERLFADLASFTGPLPFEVLALLFRLFGEELAVARAAVALIAGVSCAVVYALARRAGLGEWAHVVAASLASVPVFFFPLHSIYFYSALAYHLVLLSAYAAFRGCRSDAWAGAAGVGIACVALTKQSVGIVLLPALMLAILACAPSERRWRAFFASALGGIAVTVVTVTYYGAIGSLGAMVDSLIFLPLSFEDAFGSAFINFWPPGEFAPALRGQAHFYTPFVYSILRGAVLKAPSFSMTLLTQVLYALPFVALLATALKRTRGPLHPAIGFHAAALVALVSNLFPRTDWGHLVYCAAPALVQLLLLLAPAPNGSTLRAAGASLGSLRRRLATLGVLCIMASSLAVGVALWRGSESPNFGARIPLRPVSSQQRDPALGRVVDFLQRKASPGEAIFVARSEPLIYFASDTRNPTPYSGVIPGILAVQEEEILAALEDVRFVVMSEIDQPVFTIYRELLPGVEAYLERHFRLPVEFQRDRYGWIVVFERAEDRGATSVDLFAMRDAARSWLYGRTGEMQSVGDALPLLATSQNRKPMPMWIGPHGGGVDYSIEVPRGGVFQAGVGLASIHGRRRGHPRWVRFSVSVADSSPVAFEILASQDVLQTRGEGRSWTPFEVDLAAYEGRRITLRLEVTPLRPMRAREVAWWGSPRLVSR